MNVRIHWKHLTRSHVLEEYLERRLRFAIGRFEDRVTAVRVWLEDVNGPRGGIDKRCAIEVDGALGLRRAEVCDADLRVAVDRAARALRGSIARAADARRAYA